MSEISVSQSGVTIVTQKDAHSIRVSQSGAMVVASYPSPNVLVSQSGVTVVTCILPEMPTNCKAEVTDGGILITWQDNCSFETGYRVERSIDNGETWSVIASLPRDSTSYLDTTPSGRIVYRIVAENGFCATASSVFRVSPRRSAQIIKSLEIPEHVQLFMKVN